MNSFLSFDSPLVQGALKSEAGQIGPRLQSAVDFVETLPAALQNKIITNLRVFLELSSDTDWLPSDASSGAQERAKSRLRKTLSEVDNFKRREKAAGAKLSEVFASVDPPRGESSSRTVWKKEYGTIVDLVLLLCITAAILLAVGRLVDLLPLGDEKGTIQSAADIFQRGLEAAYASAKTKVGNIEGHVSLIPKGPGARINDLQGKFLVGENKVNDICDITGMGQTTDIVSSNLIKGTGEVIFRIVDAVQKTFFDCRLNNIKDITEAHWATVVTKTVLNSVPEMFQGGDSPSMLFAANKHLPGFWDTITGWNSASLAILTVATVANARDKIVSVWKARLPSLLMITGWTCAAGVFLYDFCKTFPASDVAEFGNSIFETAWQSVEDNYTAELVAIALGGVAGGLNVYFPSNYVAGLGMAASALTTLGVKYYYRDATLAFKTMQMALPFILQVAAFGATKGPVWVRDNALSPLFSALKSKASDARGNELSAVASDSTSLVAKLTGTSRPPTPNSTYVMRPASDYRDRGAAASLALAVSGGNVERAAAQLAKNGMLF